LLPLYNYERRRPWQAGRQAGRQVRGEERRGKSKET